MKGVGPNVSEYFELHLRGFNILNFSGEVASKPHKYLLPRSYDARIHPIH